jgi:hypothetical protein
MAGDRRSQAAVRSDTNLEHDAGVMNCFRHPTKFDDLTIAYKTIFDKAQPVTDPAWLSYFECGCDAAGSGHLARMYGDTNTTAPGDLKRLGMDINPEVELVTGEVKANYSSTFPGNRQSGCFSRLLGPAFADRTNNRSGRTAGCRLSLSQACRYGRKHIIRCQSPLQVIERRKPQLGIDDPIGSEILYSFPRHPAQARLRLQCCDYHVETLPGFVKRHAGRDREPFPQLIYVVGRQLHTGGVCQFDRGVRPNPTIKVVVKNDLRLRSFHMTSQLLDI